MGTYTIRIDKKCFKTKVIMKKIIHSFAQTFSPLRNRNLSAYLGGQLISLLGSAMQATAQSWVVWQISHSTRALGFTLMLDYLPMLLLGAFAGTWADRMDRRKLLIASQLSAMLLAVVFALLVQTGLIQLWHIYLLAALLGCVMAIDMPAQTAFVGDLSGIEQMRGAIVLNNMVRQISRTAGPALAGVVIGLLDVAPAFWINGASFLAVVGSLLYVRSQQVRNPQATRTKTQLKEAFQFISKEPRIRDLLLFSACVPFFAISAIGLIPAIVTDYLHAGPGALGLIMSSAGAGAFFGSLVVVPMTHQIRHPGLLLTAAMVWIGAWFMVIAYSGQTWFWVIGIFIANAAVPVVLTTSAGLLQVLAPPDMKASMMGIWMMLSFGMQPFGALLIGFIAQVVGAQTAIFFYGSAMILVSAAMLLASKGLHIWQPELPSYSIRR